MPTSVNKRRRELERKERQADKRSRRDERRIKRQLPSETVDIESLEGATADADALESEGVSGVPSSEVSVEGVGSHLESGASRPSDAPHTDERS